MECGVGAPSHKVAKAFGAPEAFGVLVSSRFAIHDQRDGSDSLNLFTFDIVNVWFTSQTNANMSATYDEVLDGDGKTLPPSLPHSHNAPLAPPV